MLPGSASVAPCAPFASLPVRVITITEKEFAGVRDSLKDAGFANPVSRFEAILGAGRRAEMMTSKEITTRALYEIEHGKTREAHSSMPSWGGVGCYLSHEALWREAAASSAGLIVAEADCRPAPGAANESARVFSDVCAFMGGPSELIWFGWLVAPEQIQEAGLRDIMRVPDRVLGLHFYYVSPAGARTLLSRSRPIEVQVDSYMGYMVKLAKMAAFVPKRSLFVQQNETGSAIQLKRVEDVMAASPVQNSNNSNNHLLLAVMLFLVAATALLILGSPVYGRR